MTGVMKFLFSIRNKMVLSSSLFIILLLGVIAAGTYAYFRDTTRQLIFDQQFSMITAKAHDLDNELLRAQKSLVNVAKVAPAAITGNHHDAQKWLDDRVGLRTYFSNGLIILDTTGTVIAAIPAMTDRYGFSSAQQSYVVDSLTTGKPYISAPRVTRTTDHPVITMTAPLRGKDGSVIGLLCGSIDLLEKEGIIGALRDIRIGSSGYLYLFTTDRTMIMHPDASRIMKQDVNPGANRLFDKALAGFEGSGETINSKGRHFLTSFKRLQSTGWILTANYPVEEAYQPIILFRNYYLLGMFLVLLTAMALAWKFGIGVSGPLNDFTRSIIDLAQPGSDKRQRLEEDFSDEIGLLAKSFNALLDEVQRRELELQESEERIHRITLTAYDGIIMMDGSGNIEFWNEAAGKMFGYARNEVLGCNLHSLLPPISFREAYRRAFQQFQQTGQGAAIGRTVELAGLRRDGSDFPLELSLSAVQVKGVWHSIGIVRDISDRKEAENALRKSEETFRTVADHIYEWEYWRAVDRSLIYCSPSCERISGYTAEEYLQDPGLLTRIIHQDDQDSFAHHHDVNAYGMASADCLPTDFRIRTRSGEERWIAHVCQEVFDAEGKTVGRRACNRDITAHKKAEEERTLFQKKLLKLSKAVENSPVTVIITDHLGRIEYVNPKFTEITGYLPEEVVGQNPRILNAGVQPKELYRELWDTILAGQEWRGDFCNRKKSGDIHWDHVSISPIRDEQGTITHFVAIKEDVTEQKRIVEELLVAQNAAHSANLSKSEFLANMSHEIRTPLNAIIGFSSVAMKSSLPPRQYEYVRKINMAGELLLAIVNDILDFSKIEAGRMIMEQIPFRLESVLANVFSLIQQKAMDKGIELSIENSPEVPSSLVGDEHRLGQIIANLLSNAVKFTKRGEITLETVLQNKEEERLQLKFTVTDSGIGISAEQINTLFQPFTQADGSTTCRSL